MLEFMPHLVNSSRFRVVGENMVHKSGMVFEHNTSPSGRYKIMLLRKGTPCSSICTNCTGQPWFAIVVESDNSVLNLLEEFCCCAESSVFKLVPYKGEEDENSGDPTDDSR